MSAFSATLCSVLCSTATQILQRGTTGDARPSPRVTGQLEQLARRDPSTSEAVARAVQRACQRLRRQAEPPVADAALALFEADGVAAEQFRHAASLELLSGTTPNLGRLLDHYRHTIRPVSDGASSPSWMDLAPLLSRLLAELLPQALAAQHALGACLPLIAEQVALTTERQASPALAPAQLLDALEPGYAPLQRIVAAEGALIERVQQTIVQGDLYQLPGVTPPDLESLYRHYCTFLSETFDSLDFRGIMQVQHVARMPLEAIYVPLNGQLDLDADRGLHPIHMIVRDTPLLVLLGNPGAGKSTLVRYILLALAQGQGYSRLGLEQPWLPMFFPIATFARARSSPGQRDLAPLAYLGNYYAGLSQPDYRPLFTRALEAGRAFVLLDGLDEVRDDRLGLARCLEAFVREWDAPGNRFIVTSRIAGYEDAPLDPRLFARATIQPFDDDAIRCFVAHWSRAYQLAGAPVPTLDRLAWDELQRQIEQQSQELAAAVFATPRVTDLARNPLLLTILALIHHQGARLPDRRVDLYRLCVEALAETWNRARSLSGHEVAVLLGDEELDERFVVNLLGPAALWLHSREPGGLVEQRDLERQLTTTLIQTDGMPRGRAERLAQSFIDLMRRDTGLLQERGYRRFGFVHLTFEEYLAARALLESVAVEDPDARIHSYACDPRWQEVVRLAVAAAPQREAQRLLLHLLHAPVEPAQRGRPAVLAGECLCDIGRLGATQRAWNAVIAALVATLGDAEAAVETRIAAGHVLGRLGDPRLLCQCADEGIAASANPASQTEAAGFDYWCPVSAGSFWSSGGQDDTAGAEPKLSRIGLPHDFSIGRYPVTNAEYRRFVEADGYDQQRWWTVEGWAFLHEQPLIRPALWETSPYSSPSQPVVGVSWYEAAAYCAWLTAQGHAHGWLNKDVTLRLPTALEWERAARHTDRRRYPWGDAAPTTQHANYVDSGLRAPTPVGCFPLGAAACGALDLAGNVWEWTSSLWEHSGDLLPRADIRPGEMPIIRGGAFNWDAGHLRCSARYWFNPGNRRNLLGFRVLLSDQAVLFCTER